MEELNACGLVPASVVTETWEKKESVSEGNRGLNWEGLGGIERVDGWSDKEQKETKRWRVREAEGKLKKEKVRDY